MSVKDSEMCLAYYPDGSECHKKKEQNSYFCKYHKQELFLLLSDYKDACNTIWSTYCYSNQSCDIMKKIKAKARKCIELRELYDDRINIILRDKGHTGAILKMYHTINKCDRKMLQPESGCSFSDRHEAINELIDVLKIEKEAVNSKIPQTLTEEERLIQLDKEFGARPIDIVYSLKRIETLDYYKYVFENLDQLRETTNPILFQAMIDSINHDINPEDQSGITETYRTIGRIQKEKDIVYKKLEKHEEYRRLLKKYRYQDVDETNMIERLLRPENLEKHKKRYEKFKKEYIDQQETHKGDIDRYLTKHHQEREELLKEHSDYIRSEIDSQRTKLEVEEELKLAEHEKLLYDREKRERESYLRQLEKTYKKSQRDIEFLENMRKEKEQKELMELEELQDGIIDDDLLFLDLSDLDDPELKQDTRTVLEASLLPEIYASRSARTLRQEHQKRGDKIDPHRKEQQSFSRRDDRFDRERSRPQRDDRFDYSRSPNATELPKQQDTSRPVFKNTKK